MTELDGSVLDILIYVFDRYMLDDGQDVPERDELAQNLEGDHLQGADLAGVQTHRWGHAVLVGLKPPPRTNTPGIAGLQPWKAIGRGWRAQIVALGTRVGQEGLRNNAAHRVATEVAGIRAAAAIPEPTRHRLATAALQRFTENVAACGKRFWSGFTVRFSGGGGHGVSFSRKHDFGSDQHKNLTHG